MTDISEYSYRELASPHFGEVFSLLDKICQDHHIPVYLIGAHAKIIHLLKNGIIPKRGTKDIDFAVMLPDMNTYESLRRSLENVGFRKAKEPYRMIYIKTDTVIDILPFGKVEEAYTIKFTDRETELSVIGLKEVLAEAVETRHEEIVIKLSPLAGLLILKLISWKEKPIRTKDLDDIIEIIQSYFDIESDRFYNNYSDMTEELNPDDFKLEAGAFLAGIDMKRILANNRFLKDTITGIVSAETKENQSSISSYFAQKEYIADLNKGTRIFELMLTGIQN